MTTTTELRDALLDKVESMNSRAFPLLTVADLDALIAQVEADRDLTWRQLLWSSHGHTGLYGDDGEMQCGAADFLRDDPQTLLAHLAAPAQVAAEARAGLVVLASTWVAFAHGYAHQPDWHSESDWRECQSFPCNEAIAALAATQTSTHPAPHPADDERADR